MADPDELLTEEGVVDGIRQRGFEIVPFVDHVAFRYAYELRFREAWDRGNSTNLVVVWSNHSDARCLPFDIVELAERERRFLSFSLAELFPSLAPHVLSELDRSELDAVAAAQEMFNPEPMGENATRDFVLRNVLLIDPAQIQSTAALLRTLLRRHYNGTVAPRSLDDRLIHLLQSTGRWSDWPLDQIVPSRAIFLKFLQERWVAFLQQRLDLQAPKAACQREDYDLELPGPAFLPFDHDDVRVYIENLFTDGLLLPTTSVSHALFQGTWMAVGVAGSQVEDDLSRFRKLIDLLKSTNPSSESDHQKWLQVASRWGEVVALRWSRAEELLSDDKQQFDDTQHLIETAFQDWMLTRYASLHSLAYLPRPAMLHQIPQFMAYRLRATGSASKMAVLVIDGLAIDQWVVIRQEMPTKRWITEEAALFAWVPTLTSVSRQSIFAGEPPLFFAQSLGTTSKEEQHWMRVWEDHDRRRDDVAYACQGTLEDDDAFISRIEAEIDKPQCRVAGIVVGTIDQMLHGIVTGTAGMHAQVRHWAKTGSLWRLLDALVNRGFEVIVTADHGNVGGIGIGKPNVGVTAEERGERVHVFSSALLRSNVAAKYPGSIEWPCIGLPDGYLGLIAPPLRSFILEGRKNIAHGGICIEEAIVPFVIVARA